MEVMLDTGSRSLDGSQESHEGSPTPKPKISKKHVARVVVYCAEHALAGALVDAVDANNQDTLVGIVESPEDLADMVRREEPDVVVAAPGLDDDFDLQLVPESGRSTPVVLVERDQTGTDTEQFFTEGYGLPTEVTHLGVEGLPLQETAAHVASYAFEAAQVHRMWVPVAQG